MLMYAMLLCVSCRGLADCAQRLAAKVAWHSALAKLPRKVSGSLPVYCLLLFSPLCCPLTLSHMCHAAAEGEGYGSGKAYGNSTAYLAFAGVQTGLAGLMAALPESVRPVCWLHVWPPAIMCTCWAQLHCPGLLTSSRHLSSNAENLLPCPAGT